MAPLSSQQLILTLIGSLLWAALTDFPTRQTNKWFNIKLTSLGVVQALLYQSGMQFAPGLLAVLESALPPAIAYLKSLPTDFDDKWAVYVLVAEKPGCRTLLYVGSGTDSDDGVAARLEIYDDGTRIPIYVEQALKDGYVIAHRGLLCWMSTPTAGHVPIMRLLCLALEATFLVAFWAVYSKKENAWSMGHHRRWSLDLLPYDGLCSHIPCTEGPRGDFTATFEELEAAAVQRKLDRADYHHDWRMQQQSADPVAYREKAEKNRKNFVANTSRETMNAYQQTCRDKAKREGRNKCHPCNKTFGKPAELRRHERGPQHIKVAEAAARAAGIGTQ